MKEHIGDKRGRPTKSCVGRNTRQRVSTRESDMRGINRIVVAESSDCDPLLSSHPLCKNKKMKLLEVFDVLNLEKGQLHWLRNHGIKNVRNDDRRLRYIKQMLGDINRAILDCVLFNQTDQEYVFNQVFKRNTVATTDECSNIDPPLLQLAVNGNRKVSIIAQSVLARSCVRSTAKQKLMDHVEKLPSAQKQVIPRIRTTMGKVKFASLRRTYDILNNGGDVPKHDYSFRIDAGKIASCIQYLQQTLQVKPGSSRDVSISGHVFENMPIYERGGKSKDSLYNAYVTSFDDAQRIGRQTF